VKAVLNDWISKLENQIIITKIICEADLKS